MGKHTRYEFPSEKNGYRPMRKRDADYWFSALCLVVLVAFLLILWGGIFHGILTPKASAEVRQQTEEEWEIELCQEVGRYSNSLQFRDYCYETYGI